MKQYKQVTRSVDDLIPYVNNSRTHSDEQIAQVASSIKEFGFTNPILIDDNNGIIAGHGRLLASQKLKLEEVPCIVLDGLSEAQRKAYVIADNQLALNSDWDYSKLKVEVDQLIEHEFNLDLLGLDLSFMDETPELDSLGLTPEDKLDNYLNGDTKIIRLAYSQEELESITSMLDTLIERYEHNDYSECVYMLVSKAMANG
jgi:ParB-like chromosome segregation protein Spo0J